MLHKFLFILALAAAGKATAQGVGIGTTQPHASAALEIKSTTKGLLLPSMTNAQMRAIANPANSLLVFNSDDNAYWYYRTGSGWQKLDGGFPISDTINTSATVLSITNNNTQTNAALWTSGAQSGNTIYGESAGTAPGIQGYNSGDGFAVFGYNYSTGHGVHARGKNLTGLFADIPTGTGTAAKFLNANPNGIALEVQGKMSIIGGNTNPNNGYLLTSLDGEGNAVWKPAPTTHERIAFEARGMAGNGANVMYGNDATYKYHAATIVYNAGNDFNTISQSPSSTFIVPKDGLYALKAMITFPMGIAHREAILIKLQRGGQVTIIGDAFNTNGYEGWLESTYTMCKNSVSLSRTVRLEKGDRVWLELMYDKEGGTISTFDTGNEYHYFSGVMLWED